jgi:hypothetical protein
MFGNCWEVSMWKILLGGLVLGVVVSSSALADNPDISQIDPVLELAKQDAVALIATGTVCEGLGLMGSERDISCGLTGIRADLHGLVWTTRCFVLCSNGMYEPGNFCKFPTRAGVTLADAYCDR